MESELTFAIYFRAHFNNSGPIPVSAAAGVAPVPIPQPASLGLPVPSMALPFNHGGILPPTSAAAKPASSSTLPNARRRKEWRDAVVLDARLQQRSVETVGLLHGLPPPQALGVDPALPPLSLADHHHLRNGPPAQNVIKL